MKLAFKSNYKLKNVSEWAESKRVLPPSVTALSGKYKYSYTPYLKEIADCLSVGSGIMEVAFMKSAQIGATTGILENYIGYIMDNNPGPTMFASATKEMAQEKFETNLFPMIELSGLKDKLLIENNVHSDKKNKKQAAKKDIIRFAGGFVIARGFQAAAGLKSVSIKNLVLDEIDEGKIDLDQQGDPIHLATARTKSMGRSKKILYISTPKVKGLSRIEKYYNKGDCRKYHVPCPDCGHKQHLVFSNLIYSKDEDDKLIENSVAYKCESCGVLIESFKKKEMIASGEWIPTKKSNSKSYRSYHLNALYAPEQQNSWLEIVQEFLEKKENRVDLKSFVNNTLGEPWQERENKIHYSSIWSNKLDYNMGELPEGVSFITTATDVQRNGLYIEVLGWGHNRQSWLIDFMFIEGDTSDLDSAPWKKHEEVITKRYNQNFISICNFIDSGDQSSVIYDYCRCFEDGVLPIKGQSNIVNDNPFRIVRLQNKNIELVHINTYYYKDNLFSYLKKEKNKGKTLLGFCNFPSDTPKNYFEMLTAEYKAAKYQNNEIVGYVYKGSKNNHALDTRVYNMAAADFVMSVKSEQDDIEYEWNDVCDLMNPYFVDKT